MKKLLLIRHAKSDWENLNLSDFDRPLNNRGKKAAPEMARRLLSKKIVPEHFISSPALRAITTAHTFAEVLSYPPEHIQLEEQIYEASANTLVNVINSIDNKFNFVALFGHNPGLTNVSVLLSNSDVYNIPTCGMVLIEFPFEDWKMISVNTGEQKMYDYPKNEA